MRALAQRTLERLFALALVLALAYAHGAVLAQARPAYTQQQLDQMLAPVALYPDPLLSQMFMASTYPLEVVEAARWSRAHPGLQGDAAVRAAAEQSWDPSVKSLVAFPQVLGWMDQNLEWTRSLGDAFLAQEPQVMETVQTLRQRAQVAGTLRSDERYRVVYDAGTIAVVPANPQIVYVPYYDPLIVYGPWWWPAYPPVHWRPWPGYYVQPGYFAGFYRGPGIALSAGFFFGAMDWHRRDVRVVNVNNYYYNTVVVNRRVDAAAPDNRAPGAWQHDPAHRNGIAYRDPDLQRRFGAWSAQRAVPPRRETPQTGTPRPEFRPAQPEQRREFAAHAEPPRTSVPPPAIRPVQPEQRREAAPRPEFHAGREPQGNTIAATRSEPLNFANHPPPAAPPHPAPRPPAREQERRERYRD